MKFLILSAVFFISQSVFADTTVCNSKLLAEQGVDSAIVTITVNDGKRLATLIYNGEALFKDVVLSDMEKATPAELDLSHQLLDHAELDPNFAREVKEIYGDLPKLVSEQAVYSKFEDYETEEDKFGNTSGLLLTYQYNKKDELIATELMVAHPSLGSAQMNTGFCL